MVIGSSRPQASKNLYSPGGSFRTYYQCPDAESKRQMAGTPYCTDPCLWGVPGIAQSNETQTPGSVSTAATTTFVTDNTEVKVVQANETKVSAGEVAPVTTGMSQDLKTFLAKPVLLSSKSGTINTSTSGVFQTIQLPQDVISNTVFADKLKGFQGLRGTIRIHFTLNSNPFQMGRLLQVWQPMGNVTGTFPAVRTSTLTLATQLPRGELDISNDRTMEADFENANPVEFFDLVSNFGSYGTLSYMVYSPLAASGGSVTAGYSVFASLVDVELVNPTYNNTIPSLSLPAPNLRPRWRGQMKNFKSTKKHDHTEAEQSALSAHPVSMTLAGVAKVATMASSIPLLGSLTGAVSWAANVGSKIAASFGYSKPVEESATRTCSSTHWGMNNSDGKDLVNVLAVLTSNKLRISTTFSTVGRDEMALADIVKRYAYFQTAPWAGTTTSGTALFNFDLCPATFKLPDVDGTVPITYYTPLSFLGRVFRVYRGPIKLKLKLVKTMYHSGRMMIAFFPGVLSSSAPTIDDAVYVHTTVVDISKGSEMEFIFPFTANHHYMDCTSAYGCVYAWVLNELVAPSTVPSTIQILIEVAGDESMEFAIPGDTCFAPYMPSALALTDGERRLKQVAAIESDLEEFQEEYNERPRSVSSRSLRLPFPEEFKQKGPAPLRFKGQADPLMTGSSGGTGPIPGTGKIGGASNQMSPSQTFAAEDCIGERVMSVLQLMKRYTKTYVGYPRAGTFTLAQLQDIVIRPYTVAWVTSNGSAVSLQPLSLDSVSLFSSLYAFNRGGMRFRGWNAANTPLIWSRAALVHGDWSDQPLTPVGTPDIYLDYNLEGLLICDNSTPNTVSVPAYHRMPTRIQRPSFVGNNEPITDPYCPQMSLRLTSWTAPTDYRLWRAVADDFQLGFFLGVPPMIEAANLPRP